MITKKGAINLGISKLLEKDKIYVLSKPDSFLEIDSEEYILLYFDNLNNYYSFCSNELIVICNGEKDVINYSEIVQVEFNVLDSKKKLLDIFSVNLINSSNISFLLEFAGLDSSFWIKFFQLLLKKRGVKFGYAFGKILK